jgi:uracil-DNA glycosylase
MRVLLCLGQISFAAALRLLEGAAYELPRPRPRFAHDTHFRLRTQGTAARKSAITLLASYHPSRQNTQTGRLTTSMWNAVFKSARQLLEQETDE